MVDSLAVPQDDYFEGENIMESRHFVYSNDFSFFPDYTAQNDYFSCFKSLEQQALSPGVLFPDYENFDFDSPKARHNNNTPGSISSPPVNCEEQEVKGHGPQSVSSPSLPICLTSTKTLCPRVRDDLNITAQPTHNVDYLAFPWHKCESDLWASRRHLELTRKKNNGQEEQTYHRLRNACWRAVAMGRLKLKKVDPQSFNWQKDQDLTWLHGPFVPQSPFSDITQNPTSQYRLLIGRPIKQERRFVKPALKYLSLGTLLARGSIPPAKKPRNIFFHHNEQKRWQKKTLRFSPEISYSPPSVQFFHDRVNASSLSNTTVNQISTNSNTTPMNSYIRQDPKLDCLVSGISRPGSTSKLEKPSFRPCHSKKVVDLSPKAVCQIPSGKQRCDQVSEDAAAFRRAFKVVVDARQRAMPTHPCHKIPLRTSIVA